MKVVKINIRLSAEDKIKAFKRARRQAGLASPALKLLSKSEPVKKVYRRRLKHTPDWKNLD